MFQKVTIVEVNCAECGGVFGMQNNFQKMRYEDGKTFYCPAGHTNYYAKRENELKALKQRNENLNKRLAWAEQSERHALEEAEHIKKEKAAIKGQLTKTRKRIANGVCPCCHRTFQNVASHMMTKHADFKDVVS